MTISRVKEIVIKIINLTRSRGLRALFEQLIFELKKRIYENKKTKKQLTAGDIFNNKFINVKQIQAVYIERDEYRFNIVLDSLQKDSFFGGVATALIMAVLYCNKNEVPLRIITRNSATNPAEFDNFLKMMNIKKPKSVEYYTDYDKMFGNNHYGMEVSKKDIFLATSWWSAQVIDSINLRDNFFYILQEVEMFFYPNGDEQLLCESVMNKTNIKFIINSKLLYDYYRNNNYTNVIENGVYFEPAFVENLYHPGNKSFVKKDKYRLFFYARPNNPRNLFYHGLRILNEAVDKGIIDNSEWEICLAGTELVDFEFSNGVKPKILGNMSWKNYADFLRSVDLGLCLMYTPHPSYPPLDLAASGGVVLTNSYRNKKELYYSKNIICKKIDENFLEELKKAISLAKNKKQRMANYENNLIARNWEKSFNNIIDFINEQK